MEIYYIIEQRNVAQGYEELDTTRWRRKAKEGRINDQVVDWLKDIEKKRNKVQMCLKPKCSTLAKD